MTAPPSVRTRRWLQGVCRPQRVVGVLMIRDGDPVDHEVFPGDTADKATV
ncbi:MAG: hypothetical protein IMW86_04255 [Hydrogenibacillus sp.]|nr:hypothetical protein [Hydrogenibacillus sp.]